MDGRTAALVTVLLTLFALFAVPAHAGVCILPVQTDCMNSTYKVSVGTTNTNYDGSSAQCTPVGLYDGSTDDVLSVNACELGCCCGATNTVIIRQAACTTGFQPFVTGDTTCQATCSVTPPTPPAQCGEGTINQDDIDAACACGATTVNGTHLNQYCCWNQQIRTDQNACQAPPGNLCAPNQVITSACYCGTEQKTGGVCCAGGQWHSGSDTSVCTTTPTVPAQCGDNILSAGEACDARYEYRAAAGSSPAGWYNTTGYGCTQNGALNTNAFCTTSCTCATAPTTNSCGNNVCDAPGETTSTCPQDCPASSVCNPYPAPTALDAVYDAGASSVQVTWTAPVGANCNVLSYSLHRTMHNGTTVPSTVAPDRIIDLTASATSFTDEPVPRTHTRVHYKLIAKFTSPTGTVTTFANKTVTLPSEDCPTPNANYCASATKAVQCTNYVPIIDNCNPNMQELCLKDTAGNAICAPFTTPCEQCNGLFGMFPNDDEEIQEQGGPTYCKDALACYKDLGRTSIEIYKSCKDIDSCTGYRSQTACIDDECDRGTCEWVTLASMPWRGVCRATEPELRECSHCNELGGVDCTAEVCQAIGDNKCVYYQRNESRAYAGINTGCFEKEDLPCEVFATQDTCEGPSDDRTQFVLNVSYSGGSRDGGTHVITSRSNDISGHGKCVWNASNSICYRDANKNGLPDDDSRERPLTLTNRVQYLLDFTDPASSATIAANQVYAKNFIVPYTSQGSFYVNITPSGQTCYPRYTDTPLVSGGQIGREFTAADTGSWNLCFYSEDASHNLEPVHTIPFMVDAQPPDIQNITNFSNIIAFQQGVLRTQVTVYFNVTQNSTCLTNLTNGTGARVRSQDGGFGANSSTSSTGLQFSVTYPQLTDDAYRMSIECKDAAGNIDTDNLQFRTDTNLTITSPSPQNWSSVYNASVDIGVHTARSATCRYGARGASFASMTPYTTTGGLVHNATINVNIGTGTYTFQSACQFTDTGITLYGDAVDDVRFSIDLQAPTTVLCDATTTGPSQKDCATPFRNIAAENQNITLRCVDGPAGNGNFGCEFTRIEYCIKPSLTTSCTPAASPTGTPVIYRNGTAPFILRYRSIDNGGNLQAIQETTINLLDLTRPQVEFTLDKP